MEFAQSKDLDCFKKGKNHGVWTRVKIWIVIKKGRKKMGFG